MSGPPVVITTSLGRPVTNVASLNGALPMVVVDALGEPVTLVDALGEPVTLLNPNGTLWFDGPAATFIGDPFTEGLNDSAVVIRIQNATIGTSFSVSVSSSGGGTPPANQTGTVTTATFDRTFNLTDLNAGTLTTSYSEDSVEVATDTAVLQGSQAGSPIGLLLILTKAA